jgi:polyisoprenoid-binding protein YceI
MSTATEQAVRLPIGTWEVDSLHSSLGFEVRHLGISAFRGGFKEFEGKIVTGEEGLERVEGTIETASIDVTDEQLGGHLRSPDFFDVEAHPQARFVSTSIERTGDGRYRLLGDFTLRGVTKPVELDVTVEGAGVDPSGNERIALSAVGELNRNAFGISWNSQLANGASAVSEKVRLLLSAEAVRSE